jgi:hypothetical protein
MSETDADWITAPATCLATMTVMSVLAPCDLPTTGLISAQIDHEMLDEIRIFAERVDDLSDGLAADGYRRLASRLRAADVAGGRAAERIVRPTGEATADEPDHDHFFHIRRVAGASGSLFLTAIADAAALFHGEVHRAYGDAAARRFLPLGRGLSALLRVAVGCASPAALHRALPAADLMADQPPAIAPIVPLQRWILGHQIFAVLTQGVVFAFEGFERTTGDGDEAAAEAWLRLAVELFHATAAAFRFAADFPPAAYRDIIRPLMMPPRVGAGFSGLLSADHRALVEVMTRLRPVMGETAARHAEAHAALRQAHVQVYDDHKMVCAAFDGAESPSLRGAGCGNVPGTELLDRFKVARTRLLRPAGSRARAVSPAPTVEPVMMATAEPRETALATAAP